MIFYLSKSMQYQLSLFINFAINHQIPKLLFELRFWYPFSALQQVLISQPLQVIDHLTVKWKLGIFCFKLLTKEI